MKLGVLFLFVSAFAIIGCKENKEPTEQEKINEAFQQDAPSDEETPALEKITYNPRYTYEEWISSLSDRLFKEDNVEILAVMELDDPAENVDILFAVETLEGPGFYRLVQRPEDLVDFQTVEIHPESVIGTYAKNPSISSEIYKLQYYDVDYDEIPEILASSTVFGMVGAEDGMVPFDKIQHDVFEFENDQVSFDLQRTRGFNQEYGIELDGMESPDPNLYLYQKYFESLDKQYDYREVINLITDMGVGLNSLDTDQTTFLPVREMEEDYVFDLGYNYYEVKIITTPGQIEFKEDMGMNFPFLFVEDHGEYLYSIEQIKLEEEIITMTLDRLYYDDYSGQIDRSQTDPINVTFQNWNGNWVMTYYGNPLMLKSVVDTLEEINSNAGQ